MCEPALDTISCIRQTCVRKCTARASGTEYAYGYGNTSHKRAILPSLSRYDTAEHAAQPIGLLPHLWGLQSHVARDGGGAARRKGTPSFSPACSPVRESEDGAVV